MVLRGLAAKWPATQWSFDGLRDRFGEATVHTVPVKDGRPVLDAERGVVTDAMPFGGFLEAVQAGRCDHYLTTRLDELPPDLVADIPTPPYCVGAPWLSRKLWVGAAGIVSPLHWDLADNLHVQLAGRKRFTLVSPQQSGRLYPNGLLSGLPNGCRVDIEQLDDPRFPKLREAAPVVAELEPGDAIYLPRRWWHHVRTLDASVSVNFWWASGPWYALVAASDLAKRVRGVSR